MSAGAAQNEFGYFGKLPTLGDFVHQVLPQDFANSWHQWLQQSMAGARERLGDDFLAYYLNCPVWKFLLSPGVCGEQGMAGLTIPSVDRVGRYFNFTLATVLPENTDPCAYALHNSQGFMALESLALDILEQDYPREEVELKVREITLQFRMTQAARRDITTQAGQIELSQDFAGPFADQSGALLSHLVSQNLGEFSLWWCGLEGQTRSRLVACSGLPSPEAYIRMLTLDEPPEAGAGQPEEEMNYVDKIIAGEAPSDDV